MTTRVLFIAGWGRSGTTVLDNILNSYRSVFSAGELFYLWRRGLVQGRSCGCGTRLPECALWNAVLRTAFGGDPPDPRQMVAMQREVTRVRETPRLTGRRRPERAIAYQEIMSRLYRAIGEVTGADLVVDSSKLPSAAAILSGARGVEPYLLQMVRDPRAVAYSWMRPTPQLDRGRPRLMDRHGPAESTSRWLVWNALTERVARAYPGRYRRLRYEDFAADPRTTVEQLLAFTGMPSAGGPFQDRATVTLRPNHTVSGNPGRFRTGSITIRPDETWRHAQPRAPRLAATALSLPLLRRYGYPVRAGAGREALSAPRPRPARRSAPR